MHKACEARFFLTLQRYIDSRIARVTEYPKHLDFFYSTPTTTGLLKDLCLCAAPVPLKAILAYQATFAVLIMNKEKILLGESM
jgi:hypothetical protein